MQSTHKETPLPWICSHQGNDTDFCIHAPKEADGCCPIVAIVMHQMGEIERVGNIKNAYSQNGEFIVRACNAYDEMLAALKSLEPFFDSLSGARVRAVQAAIAKAEGR